MARLTRLSLRSFVVPVVLAATAAFALPASAQEKIELKFSHFLPTTHTLHFEFAEPWAKEVEKRTNGKVVVRVFPATSSLGNVANQVDQVRAGVVDIAMGLHAFPRGRFPRTQIAELPFLFETADAASKTLWALYPKYLKDDQGYQGLRPLALHAHNGGLIHTRDRKVAKMEDLSGLRIRTPSAPITEMIKFLGGTPVGLPPGAVYENVQKGVIDGFVFPWDPLNSYKLAELTKFHLDARAYTVPFFVLMNEKKYQSLPADVRKVIDETTGQTLVNRLGTVWDHADDLGREAAKKAGSTLTALSKEERERWVTTLAGQLNRQILELENGGVKNAREIYLEMQKANERFSTRK
jgi:TRAP-type C4-dicarboxylate transport system substrate-binding protein